MNIRAFLLYLALIALVVLVILLATRLYPMFEPDYTALIPAEGWFDNDLVLARVDGDDVLADEVNKLLKLAGYSENDENVELRAAQRDFLNNVISNRIYRKAARANSVTVEEYEIDNALREQMDRYGQENFEESLRQYNLTMDDYRQILQADLLKRKLDSQFIEEYRTSHPPTDKEIKDYYDNSIAEFSYIYVMIHNSQDQSEVEDAREKAQMILGKLEAGEDFSDLARKYSDLASAKATGGHLGAIFLDDKFIFKDLRDVALKLAPGDYCKVPLMFQNGFHIIKREKERAVSLEELKYEIKQRIMYRKLEEALVIYRQEMHDCCKIDIYFK